MSFKYYLHINNLEEANKYEITSDVHMGSVSELSEYLDLKDFSYKLSDVNIKIADFDLQNSLNVTSLYNLLLTNDCFLSIYYKTSIIFLGKLKKNTLKKKIDKMKFFTEATFVNFISYLSSQKISTPYKQNLSIKESIEYVLNRAYGNKVGKYQTNGTINGSSPNYNLILTKDSNNPMLELSESTTYWLLIGDEIIEISSVNIFNSQVILYFLESNREQFNSDRYTSGETECYVYKDMDDINYISGVVAEDSKNMFLRIPGILGDLIEYGKSDTDVDYNSTKAYVLSNASNLWDRELYLLETMTTSNVIKENIGKIFDQYVQLGGLDYEVYKIIPVIKNYYAKSNGITSDHIIFKVIYIRTSMGITTYVKGWRVYNTSTKAWITSGTSTIINPTTITTSSELTSIMNEKAIINKDALRGSPIYLSSGTWYEVDYFSIRISAVVNGRTYLTLSDGSVQVSGVGNFVILPIVFSDLISQYFYFIEKDIDGKCYIVGENGFDLSYQTDLFTTIDGAISSTKEEIPTGFIVGSMKYRNDVETNCYSKVMYQYVSNQEYKQIYIHWNYNTATFSFEDIENVLLETEYLEHLQIGYTSAYSYNDKFLNTADVYSTLVDDKDKLNIFNDFRKLILNIFYYNFSDNKIYFRNLFLLFEQESSYTLESNQYEIVEIFEINPTDVSDSFLKDVQDKIVQYVCRKKFEKFFSLYYKVVKIKCAKDSILKILEHGALKTSDGDEYKSVVIGTKYYTDEKSYNEYTLIYGYSNKIYTYNVTANITT